MVPPTPPTYERSPLTAATLEDLNKEALEAFLRLRVPTLFDEVEPAQLAASVGVLAMGGGRMVPTVAGLLLFGRQPQLLRPEWGVSLVRVSGHGLDDPILAREDLEGDLPSLLAGAEAFIEAQSRPLSALASGGQDRTEYPAEAVRQVLLNALVHRDYRLSGKVAVRLFDQRLEVWSPGGMLLQVQPGKLARKGGVSFPRNPLLAASLRLMGMMDSLGRGLPIIRRAMSQVTSVPVGFASSQTDFLVTLPSALGAQPEGGAGN